MKKRILSLILSVVLTMACFVFPANAEGLAVASAVTATTTASATTVSRGDVITISLVLPAKISKVTAAVVKVQYDDTVVEFNSMTGAMATKENKWIVPNEESDVTEFFTDADTVLSVKTFKPVDKQGMIAYTGCATTLEGEIFTAKFKVLDDAKFGETQITCALFLVQVAELTSTAAQTNIECINVPATITVACKAHDFTAQNTDAKYLAEAATCTAAAKYYFSCTSCGEKGTETFDFGTTTDHTFDKKVEKDEYLVSKASCTAPATYNYSCQCGAKGTSTFTVGEKLPHTFDQKKVAAGYLKSAADCENAAVYYYSCACGEKGSETFVDGVKLGHTGGEATCTQKAVCTRCGQGYGELKAHVYDKKVTTDTYLNKGADCKNSATYFYSCACGAKGTETFTHGEPASHNYVDKITTEAYLKSGATCTSPAIYYYACSGCGEKGNDTYESGKALPHNFDQKKVAAGYLKSAADCENAAVYYYSCACGEKGSETFVDGVKLGHTGGEATCTQKAVCTRCGQGYGELKAHVYDKKVTTDTYLNKGADCKNSATYFYSCYCGAKGTETFAHGEPASHNYVDKITTEAYLKSGATCTTPAIYYYACSGCGEKGNDTYESGETLPHTFNQKKVAADYLKSAADCENAAVYYYSCACGEKGSETFVDGVKLGHTGGEATCTQKAVCTRCGQGYGELKAHTYDQKKETADYLKAAATCTSKTTYYYSCACGAKGEATFEVGETLPHTFDQQKADAAYLKSAGSCTEKAVYYYSCACGEKGTETFEYGEAQHAWSKVWTSNETEHWHECTKCGAKSDAEAHTPNADASTYNDKVCTVCGYIIEKASGHAHNYDKWLTDDTHHQGVCSSCGLVGVRVAHVYTNDCDDTCDVCGYVRESAHKVSEWKTDTNKHWHECADCGLKVDEDVHTPGAAATETTAQTCTVCGYVIKAALGHTHAYGDWVSDAAQHWKACSCGDKTQTAAHTWDAGVVTKEATEQAEGVKTFTCTVCKATKTEAIEKLPATTTQEPDVTTEEPVTEAPTTDAPVTDAPVTEAPTTEAPTTEAPATDDGCGGFVALGIVACIIPAAIVICRKKED